MYSARHDCGVVENYDFEVPQLNEIKKECQRPCFSTLNHNPGFCYKDSRVLKMGIAAGAPTAFKGVDGSFACFVFGDILRRWKWAASASSGVFLGF
jgi:hypothetical protein